MSQEDTPSNPMAESILTRLSAEPDKARLVIRNLETLFPNEIDAILLRWLVRYPQGPLAAPICNWFRIRGTYVRLFVEENSLTCDELIAAVQVLKASDPEFFLRIATHINDQPLSDNATVVKLLEILAAVDAASVLVPCLRRLAESEDPKIQSKAVALLCRLRPNRDLVARQLRSLDPRVRANAIEALWHLDTADAKLLFASCLTDRHPRVVANAALGLYFAERSEGIPLMRRFSAHASAGFRNSMAWAIGQTRDPELKPLLEKLATDTDELVRNTAQKGLINWPEDPPPAEPEPSEEPAPESFVPEPQLELRDPNYWFERD